MYQVEDEPIETIHVYVVREEEKRPYTALPLFCAFLCLLGIVAMTFYSAQHPYYTHERLTVPAEFLPLKVFTAQAPIIPTGVKTYPATTAHGSLTITNGSVISQTLPVHLILMSSSGVSVVTDQAVFVPAGNANGYGYATTPAHLAVAGKNLPALAVNQVLGTSLYIRNLQPFTGGRPAYSVVFVTAQDTQRALLQARTTLAAESIGLHYPCSEQLSGAVTVTWRCQFIAYHIPAFYHVTDVRIIGKNLMLDVWFVAHQIHIWPK